MEFHSNPVAITHKQLKEIKQMQIHNEITGSIYRYSTPPPRRGTPRNLIKQKFGKHTEGRVFIKIKLINQCQQINYRNLGP